MTILKNIFLIICLVGYYFCHAQKQLTSDEALKKYGEISELMYHTFPGDYIKTFRRYSFSEQQLQKYLSQHYTRMDLLPLIEEHHLFKMQSYFESGNWFREIGFPNESIKWYKIFFDFYEANVSQLTKKEKDDLFQSVAFSYCSLADNYAKVNKLDSAALFFEKSIKFTEGHHDVVKPSAYNNYGMFFYFNKKDLDSALIYYNKAYQITEREFPKHTLLGSIRDNIADVYVSKNQLEKALPLYKENFKLYSTVKNEFFGKYDLQRLISAGAQQLETEVKLNQLDQADQTFLRLQEVLLNPEFKKEVSASSRLELLKSQESLFRARGNYKEAYAVSLKQRFLKDSLDVVSSLADHKWQEELNTISLDRVALNFKIDKILADNQISSQRFKLWIISILSLSIIGFLIALYFRRKGLLLFAKHNQLIAEQNLKLTDFENKQLQSEIASKKRDLSDFAISLTQNQEWAKELAEKIKHIKNSNFKEQGRLIKEFEHEIQNKITVDSDTQEFHERLDKLSDSFYSELTKQFVKLSKNEVRLCSLIRLKMDSRSIATLQNITLSSLNTSRYRLRKKLNLQEDIDLDDYIQSL